MFFVGLRLEETKDIPNFLVDVGLGQFQMLRPGQMKKVFEKPFQTFRLLLNGGDLSKCAFLRNRFRNFFEILGQQTHIHPNCRERIIDLVGQTSRQAGDLVELTAQRFFGFGRVC